MTSNSADSAKEASADFQVSVSAEESVPGPRKEPAKSAPEPEERSADADERASPRSNFSCFYNFLENPFRKCAYIGSLLANLWQFHYFILVEQNMLVRYVEFCCKYYA